MTDRMVNCAVIGVVAVIGKFMSFVINVVVFVRTILKRRKYSNLLLGVFRTQKCVRDTAVCSGHSGVFATQRASKCAWKTKVGDAVVSHLVV